MCGIPLFCELSSRDTQTRLGRRHHTGRATYRQPHEGRAITGLHQEKTHLAYACETSLCPGHPNVPHRLPYGIEAVEVPQEQEVRRQDIGDAAVDLSRVRGRTTDGSRTLSFSVELERWSMVAVEFS